MCGEVQLITDSKQNAVLSTKGNFFKREKHHASPANAQEVKCGEEFIGCPREARGERCERQEKNRKDRRAQACDGGAGRAAGPGPAHMLQDQTWQELVGGHRGPDARDRGSDPDSGGRFASVQPTGPQKPPW